MKVLNKEEFIEKANKIHNLKYCYDKVIYINNRTKIIILCHIHGEFIQTAHDHLKGHGCKNCKYDKLRELNLDTKEEFIEKANKIHKHKYDYSKVEYNGSRKKVIIICYIHGEFLQNPNDHLQGNGCSNCMCDKLSELNLDTKEEFIEKANKIHKEKYNYDKVEYNGSKKKVVIICLIHGKFIQTAHNHLTGHGCPNCSGNQRSTKEAFIEKSNKIHQQIYNYDKVEYINNKKKVVINCPTHGQFIQTPLNHLSGHGCPKCSSINSKGQLEWLEFIENSLGYKLEKNKTIKVGKKRFHPDGFDPITNKIYEFDGDFWHGNPQIFVDPNEINPATNTSYGYLHELTLQKRNTLTSAGYNVIHIYESRWNEIKKLQEDYENTLIKGQQTTDIH